MASGNKSCPFCGSADVQVGEHLAGCRSCAATTPASVWNTRSPAPGLWVPVSERLPEVGADVLTLLRNGDVGSDVFDEFPEDGFDGNPTTLRWFEFDVNNDVTHWMSRNALPAPPEQALADAAGKVGA